MRSSYIMSVSYPAAFASFEDTATAVPAFEAIIKRSQETQETLPPKVYMYLAALYARQQKHDEARSYLIYSMPWDTNNSDPHLIATVKMTLQQIDKIKKQSDEKFYLKRAQEFLAQSKFEDAYNNVTIAIWLLHLKLPEANLTQVKPSNITFVSLDKCYKLRLDLAAKLPECSTKQIDKDMSKRIWQHQLNSDDSSEEKSTPTCPSKKAKRAIKREAQKNLNIENILPINVDLNTADVDKKLAEINKRREQVKHAAALRPMPISSVVSSVPVTKAEPSAAAAPVTKVEPSAALNSPIQLASAHTDNDSQLKSPATANSDSSNMSLSSPASIQTTPMVSTPEIESKAAEQIDELRAQLHALLRLWSNQQAETDSAHKDTRYLQRVLQHNNVTQQQQVQLLVQKIQSLESGLALQQQQLIQRDQLLQQYMSIPVVYAVPVMPVLFTSVSQRTTVTTAAAAGQAVQIVNQVTEQFVQQGYKPV